MMNGDRIVQFIAREDLIDLALGHPDPDLLPVDGLRRAAGAAFDRYGPDAVAYGSAAGPAPLISFVCARLEKIDGRAPSPSEVVLTAGNSYGLDQVATLLTRPGDAVLVESPTYHLAIRILREHPLDVIPISSDERGLRVSEVADAVFRLRQRGGRARLLYTVPTFNNPTGISLALDRRRELVALAASEGFTIAEDDVYRELAYEGEPPPSLWSMAEPGIVVRLGSFSKSLAPGLRVGYLTADEPTARRFSEGGLLESGGGISHFASLVVAEYALTGEYASNVLRLREEYRRRRDALTAALDAEVGDAARWISPDGGYFVWVTMREQADLAMLLELAEQHGTSFVPGPVFHPDGRGGQQSVRLAFSRYPAPMLAEAVRRIGSSLLSRPGHRAARA
jgi:2-aminoadipate transaminase